ncbi:uncharacterized protein LOC131332554 [Rhododendron vialii]|uniref:uncharacterized protein LOC131332554 n=1 Tax=Rhododendron vialii TaxID=182163 RepID=UPI00265F4263|nr:uncharacterized protein LOC131332554 [Rhododendron vialii]
MVGYIEVHEQKIHVPFTDNMGLAVLDNDDEFSDLVLWATARWKSSDQGDMIVLIRLLSELFGTVRHNLEYLLYYALGTKNPWAGLEYRVFYAYAPSFSTIVLCTDLLVSYISNCVQGATGSWCAMVSPFGGSVDTTDSEYDDDTHDNEPGCGSLLRHAREVYASPSFEYMFENEYKKSKTLDVDVSTEEDDRRGFIIEHKIQKMGHKFREYTVTAMPLEGIRNCSCKFFDLVGILCCHGIKVLGCLRIEKIPDHLLMKWQTKNGNRLMGACSVKKSGSKDDLDMLTKSVCTPLLRPAGVIYLGNFFRISQETFKRSEYLSVETVCETFGDRELIYDGEARKRSNSRYQVDAPLLRHTRDIYTSNVFSVFQEVGASACQVYPRDV